MEGSDKSTEVGIFNITADAKQNQGISNRIFFCRVTHSTHSFALSSSLFLSQVSSNDDIVTMVGASTISSVHSTGASGLLEILLADGKKQRSDGVSSYLESRTTSQTASDLH